MKETLQNMWNKVVENRDMAIRVTSSLVGAAVGAAIAAMVLRGSTYDPAVELDVVETD